MRDSECDQAGVDVGFFLGLHLHFFVICQIDELPGIGQLGHYTGITGRFGLRLSALLAKSRTGQIEFPAESAVTVGLRTCAASVAKLRIVREFFAAAIVGAFHDVPLVVKVLISCPCLSVTSMKS